MGVTSLFNNPMRILVADDQLESCKLIDKSLGMQGYFRVCSVRSFEELTRLTHYSPSLYERFDLLIINVKLLTDAGINPIEFCVNNSRLRNVLLHGSPELAERYDCDLWSYSQHIVRVLATFSHEKVFEFLELIGPKLNARQATTTERAIHSVR